MFFVVTNHQPDLPVDMEMCIVLAMINTHSYAPVEKHYDFVLPESL